MEKEKRYTVAEFATSGWSAVDEKSVHLTREQAQKDSYTGSMSDMVLG